MREKIPETQTTDSSAASGEAVPRGQGKSIPCYLPELVFAAAAFLLLTLFPLFFPVSGYENMTRAKELFFLLLMGVGGVSLFAAAFLTDRLPLPAVLWRRFSLGERLLCLFLAAALLSTLISPHGAKAWLGMGRGNGFAFLLMYVALTLCAARLGRFRFHVYIPAISVTLFLMAGLAVLQLLGNNPFGLYPEGLTYQDGGVRYTSWFLSTVGNTNVLAGLYCLLLPLLVAGIRWLRGWQRLLAAAALAASLLVMVWMQVSSCWVALFVTFLVVLPLWLPQRYRRIAAAGVILLVWLILLCALLFPGEEGTWYEFSSILRGRAEDSFGSSRILLWREALASGKDHLLLGTGPGTRSMHFTTVFQRVSEAGVTLTAAADSSHNEYLDLWLEVGLLGLFCYLAAVLAALTAALHRCTADRHVLALGTSVFCYLVQAMFNFSVIILAPLYWLLLGFLFAHCKKSRSNI